MKRHFFLKLKYLSLPFIVLLLSFSVKLSYAQGQGNGRTIPTSFDNPSIAKMFTRVESAQRQLQSIKREQEDQSFTLQSLENRVQELSVEFDLRIRDINLRLDDLINKLEEQGDKAYFQSNTEQKPSLLAQINELSLTEQEYYRQGVLALSSTNYKAANLAFSAFAELMGSVEDYVQIILKERQKYALNGYFWLAESEYLAGDYQLSTPRYLALLNYPNHPQRLLIITRSITSLYFDGQKDEAQKMWQDFYTQAQQVQDLSLVKTLEDLTQDPWYAGLFLDLAE